MKVRIYSPLWRTKTRWPLLHAGELRLLMLGLADWESRSLRAARARIRRKRLEVVAFYRHAVGPLAADRQWAELRIPRKLARTRFVAHDPGLECGRGVLWHDA